MMRQRWALKSQRLAAIAGLFGIGLTLWLLAGSIALAERPPAYVFPRPDAQFINPLSTIAIRDGRLIEPSSLSEGLFEVVGSISGEHGGEVMLAGDGKTILFKPKHPFAPGERVAVRVRGGLRTRLGARLKGLDFSFRTSTQDSEVTPERLNAFYAEFTSQDAVLDPPLGTTAPMSGYITTPADFPNLMVTTSSENTGAGYVFLATHHKNWLEAKPYLLIIDNAGEPVWYRKMTEGRPVNDFKKQPTGVLTYWDAATGRHHGLDDSYEIIETYVPGHGYHADFHDFQLLPNGNKLFLIWVTQQVDMSEIVAGGQPDARVTSAIIQEVDGDGNVLFEWHGLDHIPITDTTVNVLGSHIDYMHTNTITVDADDNILISSRNLHEVTKINRQTGEIMWRMGGRADEFTFIDDPDNGFALQHDIRRLPNGNITLFDNRGGGYSRAVEYSIDEVNKTATLVWAYNNEPGRHSYIMGNTQRLPGGNTMISWSSIWRADTGWTGTYPLMAEVTAASEKAWELTVDVPIFTYRGFRFPWEGRPDTAPTLVVDIQPPDTLLTYSWNGATGVAAYRVYGDPGAFPMTLLTVEPRAGFETSTLVEGIADPSYHYRVVPLDANGEPLIPDPVTPTPSPTLPPTPTRRPTKTITPTFTPSPTPIPVYDIYLPIFVRA